MLRRLKFSPANSLFSAAENTPTPGLSARLILLHYAGQPILLPVSAALPLAPVSISFDFISDISLRRWNGSGSQLRCLLCSPRGGGWCVLMRGDPRASWGISHCAKCSSLCYFDFFYPGSTPFHQILGINSRVVSSTARTLLPLFHWWSYACNRVQNMGLVKYHNSLFCYLGLAVERPVGMISWSRVGSVKPTDGNK